MRIERRQLPIHPLRNLRGARGIPTETIREVWEGEGQRADPVAEAYGISTKDVMDAVDFERALDAPLESVAA